MSVSQKGIEYLKFLSDFWTIFYSDYVVLEEYLKAEAQQVKSQYFTFLQQRLPRAVQNSRVFQEQFWELIEIVDSPSTFSKVKRNDIVYYRYKMEESYAHLPQLYNVIFSPTVRLVETQDFFIEREITKNASDITNSSLVADPLISIPNIESYILFKEDPFLNNNIPKRINTNNFYSMVLFAPHALIDDQHLYKNFGNLVDEYDMSSQAYKDFLEGLFFIFTNGPSIGALNAGMSVAAGYPVARQAETITSVILENNVFILKSDKGNEYEIERKFVTNFNTVTQTVETLVFPNLKLSTMGPYNFADPTLPDGTYPVNMSIEKFDSFITDIRVVDAETEPYWWRKQVEVLASNLVPDLPEHLRRHPEVIDYLFNKFFRFNTFGVFTDYRAFRSDFQKIPDFLKILHTVKPSYKSFSVYENDLHAFSLVRLLPGESLQNLLTASPVSDQIILADGSIAPSPPRSTVVGEIIIDPVTGLPVSGIDPTTGLPYPKPVQDGIHNVFDVIGLRSFFDIFDIIYIDKYVGMNLPLSNQPLQLGIALEQIGHSVDYPSWTVTLSPISITQLHPGIEPIIGMQLGLGMGAQEGLLQRVSFGVVLSVESEETLDIQETINLQQIIVPVFIYLRTMSEISGLVFHDTSLLGGNNHLEIVPFTPPPMVYTRFNSSLVLGDITAVDSSTNNNDLTTVSVFAPLSLINNFTVIDNENLINNLGANSTDLEIKEFGIPVFLHNMESLDPNLDSSGKGNNITSIFIRQSLFRHNMKDFSNIADSSSNANDIFVNIAPTTLPLFEHHFESFAGASHINNPDIQAVYSFWGLPTYPAFGPANIPANWAGGAILDDNNHIIMAIRPVNG